MGSILDLHVHTTVGSPDSSISPTRLGEASRAAGLDGIVVTEHVAHWSVEETARFRHDTGVLFFAEREWETDLGHIAVFGVPRGIVPPGVEANGVANARELRQLCLDHGAFVVLCHPFAISPAARTFSSEASRMLGDSASSGSLSTPALLW